MAPERKKGRRITTDSPEDTYRRNRLRYHYQFKTGKLTDKEYDKLLDINLEEYHLSKKNKKNTSLKDF